ncbi:MAG: prepilin-type N-terminal cleavage/methylation domain-containing protein [Candidatus Zixiibacteriota bacterium]
MADKIQLNQRGLTLLEVMVAMMILGVSLLLLLNMGMVALNGNDWSNKTTVASQLMQQKLEEIRSTAKFSNGSDTAQGMTREWKVTSAGTNLQKLDITVKWMDINNRDMKNSLTTYVKADSV